MSRQDSAIRTRSKMMSWRISSSSSLVRYAVTCWCCRDCVRSPCMSKSNPNKCSSSSFVPVAGNVAVATIQGPPVGYTSCGTCSTTWIGNNVLSMCCSASEQCTVELYNSRHYVHLSLPALLADLWQVRTPHDKRTVHKRTVHSTFLRAMQWWTPRLPCKWIREMCRHTKSFRILTSAQDTIISRMSAVTPTSWHPGSSSLCCLVACGLRSL